MSATVNVSSSGEWSRILGSSTIVVTDFYADWCGPCKMIAPTFESLSTKYSKPGKITFCKVNVDNQQSIAQSHGVRAMPTFLIFQNGSVIETIQGANPPALTAAVDKAIKLAGTSAPGASFKTPGRTLGGEPARATPARRGGGQTLGGGRSWNLSSFNIINFLLTFFGLYFASLFSFDPYKAAELSDFNVNKPRAPPAPVNVNGNRVGGQVRRLQDVQPEPQSEPHSEAPPPKPEDIELAVRQAKHAFGDTLPKDYLNDEEYKLYERLYGAPLRETQPEDVGMPIPSGGPSDFPLGPDERILIRETVDGQLEEVVCKTEQLPTPPPEGAEGALEVSPEDVDNLQELPSEAGLSYINAVAKSQREYNALLKLQKDFESASLRAAEEEDIEEEEPIEEEEEQEEEEEEEDEGEPDATFWTQSDRVHPHSKIGQWRTNPTSLHLPKAEFVEPIAKLLDRTDFKHVRDAAEKAFGGSKLPQSVATPASKRNAAQNSIPMEAGHHKMTEIEADAYIATNLPGSYASVMSILVEIRKRLGSGWMTNLLNRGNGDGPRVLDVGAGGAGVAAWQEVLQAEWELSRGQGKKSTLEPPGKKTVVVGSDQLRHRISRFLQNTTFLPRLPDYLHSGGHPDKLDGSKSPMPRKSFDIIVAAHQMMPLKEGFKRKAMLDNLWEMLSPEGGILIIMEKGHPRGFEAVADARSRLINEFVETPTSDPRPEPIETEQRREREQGMIVAPCTNHKECPMYLKPGLSSGRKDFCHFSQRFIRPPFLQRVLGATHRNHEDIDFSFVAVQRGVHRGAEKTTAPVQNGDITNDAFLGYEDAMEAPNPLSLPRNILPPLKRRGHVTLDLCTPAGTIERWTVPKSYSRQAYHDARKARWGDLWALGAKTRVVRPVRLGRGGAVPNDGGVRAREAAQGKKLRVINLNADSSGIYSASEKVKTHGPHERRTRGGRKYKPKDLLKELD
ncbi:Uu.00g115560.m01.CDS01 [Anthostomella pinea]|uniref:Uu.00g115560.m01.CDS01 n=1 Tax=Anthostomella pinea TaxID=933095 RepID=A0AAI8VAN7_9PEZI|nr:Uu.00g115560.m01.CDS01 [Anthostomella pinea]